MKTTLFYTLFLSLCAIFAEAQTNIAGEGTITSSPFSEIHTEASAGAANAIDGDFSTKWLVRLFKSSGTPLPKDPDGTTYVPADGQRAPQPAYIEIEFSSAKSINGFKTYEAGDNFLDYSFQTWNGSSWDTAISEEDLFNQDTAEVVGGTTLYTVTRNITPVSTTKVRLEITRHGRTDYIRFHEIEVFEGTTASLDDKFKTPISVYPNPVKGDVINIVSDVPIKTAELYNLIGKKIKSSTNSDKLDVSNISSGVYLLKVNNSQTIKFIKE